MEKGLISIIVPIYNVELYLEKCIYTILNQTYKNIEIILVDDGSTDNCNVLVDEYGKKDSRIKVIHKKNGGLSDARNAGLKIATGKYVCFIDSDDYVEADYIKELYETLIKNDADVSICSYQSVYEDGETKQDVAEKKTINNIDAIKELFTKAQNIETVTWNKMYKIELFKENNIEFPKGKLHEDNFTTYKLFYFSNKIAYTDKILYNYRQRKNSIVSTYNSKRLVILDVINEIKEFFKNKNIDLNEEIEIYELIIKLGVINILISAQKTKDSYFKKLVREIKQKTNEYLKNEYLRKKQKISIIVLKLNTSLYIFLKKIYRR